MANRIVQIFLILALTTFARTVKAQVVVSSSTDSITSRLQELQLIPRNQIMSTDELGSFVRELGVKEDSLNSQARLIKSKIRSLINAHALEADSLMLSQNLDSLEALYQGTLLRRDRMKRLKDGILMSNFDFAGITQERFLKSKNYLADLNKTNKDIHSIGNVNLIPSLDLPDPDVLPSSDQINLREVSELGNKGNLSSGIFDSPDLLQAKVLNEPASLKVSAFESAVGMPNVDSQNGFVKVGGVLETVEQTKQNEEITDEQIGQALEDKVSSMDEIEALKGQGMDSGEIDRYKKALEHYNNEKSIESDLNERTKEVATGLIMAHQPKIAEAMDMIEKAKRKFSEVQDLRNLPKRVPNPWKGKGWRERLIPGIGVQSFYNFKNWLQLDPEVLYRCYKGFSIGVGGMNRFSLNVKQFEIGDFESLYGGKVFAQCTIVKGFMIKTEFQSGRWRPQRPLLNDPSYNEKFKTGSFGISRSYLLSKRLKGTSDVLWHYSHSRFDPYPKIQFRTAFSISLRKKEKLPWDNRLKEIKWKKIRRDKGPFVNRNLQETGRF